MKMRVLGLMLTLVLVAALGLAACGKDETPQVVPERPVVRLEVGDQAYDESVYSYCWPESADNLECDVDAVALVQPVENVPVAPGSEVKIVVAPGEGEPTPTSLTATLLGFDQSQDYGAAAEGVFPVPSEDDLYRVRVDVQYGDVEGYEAYVSYVFGLDVSAEIAAAPTTAPEVSAGAETPTAAETPAAVEPATTIEPTSAEPETPFMTATFVPTNTLLPTDTVEATESTTVEPVAPEETAATGEATETAGLIAGGETPVATEVVGVAGATLEGATLAAETPVIETPRAGATQATAEVETPIPAPTETSIPAATETPLPTVAPTETSAPTATPQPTATLAPTEPPTSTPIPLPTETLAPSATPAPTEAPVTQEAPSTEQAPAETPGATPASAELGTIALNGVVRLHTAGINVPVVGAAVSYQQTSSVTEDRNSRGELYTEERGRFTFPLIALNAADTIEITASAPGFQPQTITRRGADVAQADGSIEFVLEPLKAEPRVTPRITAAEVPSASEAEPQPEASAGEAAQPEAPDAGPGLPGDMPTLTLVVAGQAYAPVGYQNCQSSDGGERTCSELPAPSGSTQRVPLQRGAMVQILIEGEAPDTLTVEYVSDGGTPVVEPESVEGDNIVLLIVAPEPGSYILALHLSWGDSEASYYFRVLVEG